MSELIKLIEEEYSEKRTALSNFNSGDTVNVHVKITEGNKQRVQQYQGTVIQRKNKGTNGETITVRKVSNGIAVERIFHIVSPSVEKIDVVRRGKVRRARIYYFRNLTGKKAQIKEKRS